MFRLFGKKKLFFLIDDDDDLAFIVSKRLKDEFHCNVQTFHSLQGAIDELQHTTPDCIISDVLLPGENGHDLKIYIDKLPIKVPIIFISQLPPDRIKNELVHIPKPINFERLFNVVRYNLGEI